MGEHVIHFIENPRSHFVRNHMLSFNMAAHRDYQVYTCNHPNSKNEDRFSETHFTTKRSELTIIGVYDGKQILFAKSPRIILPITS
jgi:hypothetical protein